MVCENLNSSSTAPNTDYILIATREFLIHNINPSDLGFDEASGLAEKERLINSITHESLMKNPGYLKNEEAIANSMGENFTNYLLDIPITSVAEVTSEVIKISYNIDNTIYSSSTTIDLVASLIDPDNDIGSYTLLWTVKEQPDDATTNISSISSLNTTVIVSKNGTYRLLLTASIPDKKILVTVVVLIIVS